MHAGWTGQSPDLHSIAVAKLLTAVSADVTGYT